MKKYYLICFILIFIIFSAFSQEKIKYGNIPYGITIEQAIEEYTPLYDEISEATYSSAYNCTFIDFTALRPMFQNIFGEIKTFSMGYTSAWTSFNKDFTRILKLTENIDERNAEITTLYFINDKNKTKLFMVSRRGGIDRGDTEKTFVANKTAVTNVLGVNARELSGRYDYYSSGSRSANAYACIWEKNNERIVLYVANNYGNTGGYIYISNNYWREYEILYIDKRNNEQRSATESAANKF